MKKLMMEKDKTIEISDAARMLEKKRILYDVEEAFQLQIEDYNKELKEFCRLEDQIKQNDFVIQKKLIKMSKHLLENKNKKGRAVTRLKGEREKKENFQSKIENVKKEITLLDEHKTIFEGKIEKLQKYEDFLKQIVEEHQDQYSDVGDFLQRFKILEKNNVKLKKLQESNEVQNENMFQHVIKYEEKKINEIMILNNEIAAFQSKLEKIEQNNLRYFSYIGGVCFGLMCRQLIQKCDGQDAGSGLDDSEHREHLRSMSKEEKGGRHPVWETCTCFQKASE